MISITSDQFRDIKHVTQIIQCKQIKQTLFNNQRFLFHIMKLKFTSYSFHKGFQLSQCVLDLES